jgi:hypothetical protein
MSATMSWKKLAVSNPEEAVRLSVRLRRMLEFKQPDAFDDASSALSLSPRYVRGIIRDEIHSVARRWRLIQRHWWADMDAHAARFRAIADEIDRQKEADQIAGLQLSLPLGDGPNDHSHPGLVRPPAVEARRAA